MSNSRETFLYKLSVIQNGLVGERGPAFLKTYFLLLENVLPILEI